MGNTSALVADWLAQWSSMGGYAAFVWPAYAVAGAVLGGLAWHSWRAHRVSETSLDRLRAAPTRQAAGAGAMTRKRRRLIALAIGMFLLAAATALVLAAFNDNLVFFYSPSESGRKIDRPGPPHPHRRACRAAEPEAPGGRARGRFPRHRWEDDGRGRL